LTQTLEEFIARLRRQVQGDVLLNEPLHRYTSFRLGGPADVLVHPSSMDDVIAVQQLSSRYEVPVTVLGAGSNVLIADAGVRGVVVRIGRSMSAVAFDGETIVADCGAPFPRLGKLSVEQGLTGLEFASGIPGTLGGALYMNAGAHNQTTAAVVEEVTAVDGTGRVLTLTAADMEFGYRSSRLQRKPGLIAVRAKLRLQAADPAEVRERMRAFMERRRRTQPIGTKNAGSVFKNPPGDFAGRLIEAAGCKGMSVGDAVVSTVHANFIVNRGNATADDVRRLMEQVQKKVFERFGVELEPEVRLLGFA